MSTAPQNLIWDNVIELTKSAQEKRSDPLLWAMRVSSDLKSAGITLPSIELANVLVSYICWDNNVPIMWKFLETALMFKIVPSMLVLALLSTRVIPSRRSHPAAYRLYMELLKRYGFEFKSHIHGPNYDKVMNTLDSVLHLCEIFNLRASEPGMIVVMYVYSVVWQLLDASLDDEDLLELTPDKKSKWAIKLQEMEIDGHDNYDEKISSHCETLRNTNSITAIEIIGQYLQDKVTSRLLNLARHNMPTHWVSFLLRIRLLGAHSLSLRNSRTLTPEALLQLTSDTHVVLSRECKISSQQKFHAVMAFGSLASSASLCHGASLSAFWLPLDLALEDLMDGYQVNATSAVEIVTSLIKTLQAVNGTSWHETFLALWIAALRLVQRERDPIEGPMPRLDPRLCMLLSITTLVIADLIEEEESSLNDEQECGSTNHQKEKHNQGKRRCDLVSSLQTLGDYQSLLTPPQSVVAAANQAAARAMLSVSGISVGNAYFECISMKDMPINCTGNMRHLIVEACIARNLLDTSAYIWPGYVNGRINQIPHNLPGQVPGWSSFLKGAELTPVMLNALVSSPASRFTHL